jgi:hypothetical protein
MPLDFDNLLEEAFPCATWPTIVRAQREGIALADDVRRNTPFLATLLGGDLRGQIRRLGVMYRLQELCKAGELPFAASIEHMPHGTWHWLNLQSGKFIAHLARTVSAGEVPEDTKNRQHYLIKNSPDLFDDRKIVPISELVAKVHQFYAYFAFGAAHNGDLTHSILGMAASDEPVWLGRHDLMKAPPEASALKPDPAPKFDPRDRLKFHQHIEELAISDQNAKDKNK